VNENRKSECKLMNVTEQNNRNEKRHCFENEPCLTSAFCVRFWVVPLIFLKSPARLLFRHRIFLKQTTVSIRKSLCVVLGQELQQDCKQVGITITLNSLLLYPGWASNIVWFCEDPQLNALLFRPVVHSLRLYGHLKKFDSTLRNHFVFQTCKLKVLQM